MTARLVVECDHCGEKATCVPADFVPRLPPRGWLTVVPRPLRSDPLHFCCHEHVQDYGKEHPSRLEGAWIRSSE